MRSKLLTNLAAVGVMAVTKPLAAAGMIRRHDPWRRATGIGLKSEGSKFTLTAFGLDLWSDVQSAPANASCADCRAHFLERFGGFIRDEACTHVQVHERRDCCEAVAADRPRTRLGDGEPADQASVCAVWFDVA